MEIFGTPVKPVKAGADLVYLAKAEEFLDDAKEKCAQGRWNSSALLAIHSVISACDAVTAFRFNVKCSGERHGDVTRLLEHIKNGDSRTASKKSQILMVISLKTRVEYEDRLVRPKEAESLIKPSERILTWAREKIRRD